MIHLCPSKIWQQLQALNIQLKPKIEIFDKLDSTHEYLKRQSSSPSLQVCLAETQSAGRGRHGQTWISAHGENIYLSLRFCLKRPIHQLHHLSLVAGLACLEALSQESLPHPILLKWPNDLIIQNHKLAGVLIDLIRAGSHETELVLSVGLNVHHHPTSLERPTTSLKAQTQKNYDRNVLAAQLIHSIMHETKIYEALGFQPFEALWNQKNALYGHTLTRCERGQLITGRVCGLNEHGWLKIEDQKGQQHLIQGQLED